MAEYPVFSQASPQPFEKERLKTGCTSRSRLSRMPVVSGAGPDVRRQSLVVMNATTTSSPVHVFVDVDDTLVRSAGTKRIPMPSVIQHVRELHAQGAVLYCWSSGGAEYARQSAEELGLAQC